VTAVLVLNADLGPLHRVSLRHALRMLNRPGFVGGFGLCRARDPGGGGGMVAVFVLDRWLVADR
jgi:hypothetical protein